jgi:CO/xanthine dehydrogenase FAD-binding subunit
VEDRERIVLAGGTDLLVAWPQRFDRHGATYVDVSKLTELRTISFAGDALVLGAAATWWDAIRDDRVKRAAPLLPRVARQVGALQIQTRGTWAGNIANASPAADGVAVLMALDAVVELVSCGGEEHVPLGEFYLDYQQTRRRPDQLIRAIRVPRRDYAVQIFEKVGARAAQAITTVGVTVTRSDAGWRVVAHSMAPTVRRCPSVERLLETEAPVTSADDLLAAIRTDVSPIDDIRSSAAYRERVMARVLYAALGDVCPGFRGRL